MNFSIFTHFLCFFLLKLLKLGEIDGVKFLAWKSGGVKFWTNSMSGLDRNIWCLPSWPNTKISFQSFYCFRQMSWKPPLRGAFMVYVARWTSEKRNKISLIGIASIQIKKNLHLTYRLTWISSPSSQDLLWGRPQTNLLTEGTMFWSLSSQDHPHRCSIAPSKVLYIEFLASLRPTAHNQGRQSCAWNIF